MIPGETQSAPGDPDTNNALRSHNILKVAFPGQGRNLPSLFTTAKATPSNWSFFVFSPGRLGTYDCRMSFNLSIARFVACAGLVPAGAYIQMQLIYFTKVQIIGNVVCWRLKSVCDRGTWATNPQLDLSAPVGHLGLTIGNLKIPRSLPSCGVSWCSQVCVCAHDLRYKRRAYKRLHSAPSIISENFITGV